MESREPATEPSDFDIFLLNAILALPPPPADAPLTPITPITPHAETPSATSSTRPQSICAMASYSSFGRRPAEDYCKPPHSNTVPLPPNTTATDKLFPTPLLKCPLIVLTAFCKEHKLDPNVVAALHQARRRKKNRKFQRIARHRREGPSRDKHLGDYESDDEGTCDVIDSERVYADMVAAFSKAAKTRATSL